MKKYLFRVALVMTMATFVASCNKSENKSDDAQAKTSAESKATDTKEAKPLRIAYVDLDSVQAHYDLCTDLTNQLEQKSINAQKELQAKTRAFQQHYNTLQQKYQNGQFSSQAEFENAQANLQKEQEAGAQRESEITAEIQKLQVEGMQQMNDSVESFIKSYNQSKKYDFILVKSTTLYANPAYDITNEVIQGLNKRYKSSKK